MRRAHLLTSLIIAIGGTNPIAIVAKGTMKVCDAAHCLEVMKTSAQTNSACIAPNVAASGGLQTLHGVLQAGWHSMNIGSNVTSAYDRAVLTYSQGFALRK
jgi:hypothetical protein